MMTVGGRLELPQRRGLDSYTRGFSDYRVPVGPVGGFPFRALATLRPGPGVKVKQYQQESEFSHGAGPLIDGMQS